MRCRNLVRLLLLNESGLVHPAFCLRGCGMCDWLRCRFRLDSAAHDCSSASGPGPYHGCCFGTHGLLPFSRRCLLHLAS